MGYILNRKEFLLEKYVSVGENTEITDSEQVAVIQGRFNPCAHIGHLNMINNAYRLTGKRVFVVQIVSNNTKSPLGLNPATLSSSLLGVVNCFVETISKS